MNPAPPVTTARIRTSVTVALGANLARAGQGAVKAGSWRLPARRPAARPPPRRPRAAPLGRRPRHRVRLGQLDGLAGPRAAVVRHAAQPQQDRTGDFAQVRAQAVTLA